MIGALPTISPYDQKCRRCLVSGRMYTCWVCGELDELTKSGGGWYDCPNGWHFSPKNREHLGPVIDDLLEFPVRPAIITALGLPRVLSQPPGSRSGGLLLCPAQRQRPRNHRGR